MPDLAELAGPHPHLLEPGALPGRRGTVAAILSRRGALGRSTIALQVAGIWACQGKRVALVDLDPSYSLARRAADARLGDEELAWSGIGAEQVLHRGDRGGELRLVRGLAGASAERQRKAIDTATVHADVVLLDTGPLGVPHTGLAAEAADVVFTCVSLHSEMFGRMETTYSDRYRPIADLLDRRTKMFEWLDNAFDDYLDEHADAPDDPVNTHVDELDHGVATPAPDRLDPSDKDTPAWEARRATFLAQVSGLATHLFGADAEPQHWLKDFSEPIADEEPPFTLQPGEDIKHTWIPFPDQDVIATLEHAVQVEGVAPNVATGKVAAALPARSELNQYAREKLLNVATACSPPLLTVSPHEHPADRGHPAHRGTARHHPA
ncbi:ParA family protein [Amycolatopsis magusensis]|uniref:ParA family protein n=1 Tax=Amycolatopsis magusensis TaxID=882444 RepID=UPI00379D74F6